MLHRAFSPMGREGIACTCFNQTEATTRQRAMLGDCFVAVMGNRIIGTVTLHKPDRRNPCRWYRQSHVASLHQFAVDPIYQGTGVGKLLLQYALQWTREHGCRELALDTPQPASHLIQYYESQGFRQVGRQRFAGKTYDSCLLSHTLDVATFTDWRTPAHNAPQRQPMFGTMVQ